MDKYTATEEAYKRGREDAIKKISRALWEYITCSYYLEDIEAWMRGLFEEER